VYQAPHHAICFALLVVVIAVTPVLAISPGWLGPQLVSLAAALMLLLLPLAPEADIRRSVAISKPLAAAILLPAAWMVLQIVPVPPGSIEHPVWRSAAAALPGGVTGHVSIDLGSTLRGLFGYLCLIALAFVTSVLTRNRDRAETTLFALCTVTTFAAVELLLVQNFSFLKPGDKSGDIADALIALSAFGAIVNLAFIVRTTERHDTRAWHQPRSPQAYAGMISLGTLAAILCVAALIQSATSDVLIATTFGCMVMGLVVLIRRLALGRWTIATVCAAVLVAWGGAIALRSAANPSVSPLFRFAKAFPAEAGAATLRMMSDANWAGGGVGSYPALAAIYRDASGVPGDTAINTVASMLLEWGGIGVLLTAVLPLQLLVVLLRGALSRGRDSFYAAGAAACLITACCEAFCDSSFTDAPVQTLAAILFGLGLSQTTGRQAG
jgi:hypothetical protein